MNKQKLRTFFKELRGSLSQQRTEKAEESFIKEARSLSFDHQFVLSYSSFQSELKTECVNKLLIEEGKLVLPKVNENVLELYRVKDKKNSLELSSWGILEPNSSICELIPYNKITLLFVPGLGFDYRNYRIGYGKGYYDRLLPLLVNAESIGVGFREQLYHNDFALEPHDVPLSRVLLF